MKDIERYRPSKNKNSDIANKNMACVASVSVRFGSKESQGDKWSD